MIRFCLIRFGEIPIFEVVSFEFCPHYCSCSPFHSCSFDNVRKSCSHFLSLIKLIKQDSLNTLWTLKFWRNLRWRPHKVTIRLDIDLSCCIFQRWNDFMLISAIDWSSGDQGTPRFVVISFRRKLDHCSCQILLRFLVYTNRLFKGWARIRLRFLRWNGLWRHHL